MRPMSCSAPGGRCDYLPVPVRETCLGDPVALPAMFRVADRLPLAVGLKTTEMVQLALTARLVVQLLVWV